ncbi:hypothetical protein TorRG33x02_267120 [Trema orientale]|uniref:Uncharacterized protein n=1 Tax=Trema orientale TaxID=63057 RepID=A0A2P5D025_TREOI|nr:hypothetical protein TorRG33x02_267120 [Trema orientale]
MTNSSKVLSTGFWKWRAIWFPKYLLQRFLCTGVMPITSKLYGPTKELLSENNPSKYTETIFSLLALDI